MMDQHTHPYGMNAELLNEQRGRVPIWLAPLCLLVRPGRFMLGYGYHASVFVVLFASWIIGSGGMTNSVINRAQYNALPEWAQVNSWGSVFALLFGLGLLRGALHYGLGSLWCWLLIRICGVRGNQWRLSSRLYCFPKLIEEVPALLGIVYMALRYNDLNDALKSMNNAVPMLVMVFLFITPVVRYCMLRASCRVRPVWSVVLFLVLPYIWRSGLIAVMLWMVFVSPPGSKPDVDHPRQFASSHFEMAYPGNWSVIDEDPGDAYIQLIADHGSAVLTIWFAPTDGPDVVEESLDGLHADGYQAVLVDEQRVTLGSQDGYGLEHELQQGGKTQRMFHFIHQLGPAHLAVFRYQANERDWDIGKLAPMLVVDSIAFKVVSDAQPDLADSVLIEREGFACSVPSNWVISDDAHTQYKSFVAQPPQGGRFWCSIFDRAIPAEKELDTYIEYSLWTESVEQRTGLDSLFGMTGVGAEIVCRAPLLGKQRVRALYVPLEDGRVLGIRLEQPEHSATTTDPGFQLIEDTFQLQGVEPASP